MTHANMPHDHGNHSETLLEHLPDQADFETVSALFKLVGDPVRLRIFWILCHCEECVTNISYLMEMSSPAVSHHLRQLRDAGLLVSRRDGKEVYYRAADTAQAQALHHMIEDMAEIACPED